MEIRIEQDGYGNTRFRLMTMVMRVVAVIRVASVGVVERVVVVRRVASVSVGMGERVVAVTLRRAFLFLRNMDCERSNLA